MYKIRSPICTLVGHVDHGKCVAGDTLIPLTDGTISTAKQLFKNNFNSKKAKKIDDGIIQYIKDKKVSVFSFDGKSIVSKNISHIWKREANMLIEVKTRSGDTIKTTPEHPFFVFSLEGLKEKRADNLKEGEYIAVPKKTDYKNKNIKEVIINRLISIDNFACFLNSNSERLVNKIRDKKIGYIERKLKIKHLRDSIRKKRLRIKDLFKIGRYLNFSEKTIYFMIDSIKNANEGWRVGHTSNRMSLNFKDPEKLGYILGCLAGDGHISNNVVLSNNDEDVIAYYNKCLKEVFNLESKTKQGHTCKVTIDNGCLTFSRFLTEVIGFPKKNKSATINVPDIAKQNKEVFKGFISGLLDTDGYVSKINHSLEFTSKSEKLIKEISILLLGYGIHSVFFKKKGFSYLRIANKLYLDKFLENFKPKLKRKLARIINASMKAETSRIFDFIPLDGANLKNLKVGGKINKRIPYFDEYKKKEQLPYNLLQKVLDNITEENEDSQKIKKILEKEVNYVKIASIKKIKNKEKYVYDFTIPKTHTFVAERILVHNTSLLDSIRGTTLAEREPGKITQHIGATEVPLSTIRNFCGKLIDSLKLNLTIPGLLFLDTPGHKAFTSLRRRGGNLADIAILVVDALEGIKPQTLESIEILKNAKTPFIIALTKIDLISGFQDKKLPLLQNINEQTEDFKKELDLKLYTVVGDIYEKFQLNAERFDRVDDYTKKVAIVPISSKLKIGLAELLMVLTGLTQKYLEESLKIEVKGPAKATVLEVKETEGLGTTIDAIVYDGTIKVNDTILIGSLDKPIKTKVRSLLKPNALSEIRDKKSKFSKVKEVSAASGVKIAAPELENVLSGMPLRVVADNLEQAEKEIKGEIEEVIIETGQDGIVVKADTLGSLEALDNILKEKGIVIKKASIGNITKQDIAEASSSQNQLHNAILGFNIKNEKTSEGVKIITGEVIYKIIEDYEKWAEGTNKSIKQEKLSKLVSLCKVKIMPGFIFRQSNPAVVGIEVLSGKLKVGTPLMLNGKEITSAKSIQLEGENIQLAEKGKQVAVSLPGVTIGRQLKEGNILYSLINETDYREFKKVKDLLDEDSIEILKEIADMRRKENAVWGV